MIEGKHFIIHQQQAEITIVDAWDPNTIQSAHSEPGKIIVYKTVSYVSIFSDTLCWFLDAGNENRFNIVNKTTEYVIFN